MPKCVFGVFRADRKCPLSANVVLFQLRAYNSAPRCIWLDFRGHFMAGKEKGK